MARMSLNRLLRAATFAAGSMFQADRLARLDCDELAGKVEGRPAGERGSPNLGRKLAARLGLAQRFGFRRSSAGTRGLAFDPRQRAIVKIHYFSHAGGGAAGLKAHVRYVGREAANRSDMAREAEADAPERATAQARARAHAAYLARDADPGRSAFYDADSDRTDGASKTAEWAKADRRHFRLIIAPENGAALGDLKPFVREVMARAEAALGSRLEWIGVDHWDTDNPHSHIVLRGRRPDGRDLIIPREFVRHGFRNAARDAATERLGWRGPEDERLALEREARAHRPTRLDSLIAAQIRADRRLRVSRLAAPNHDPDLANALKARARELRRLGLAEEIQRNELVLAPDWRERLKAMELHFDVRKRLMNERALEHRAEQKRALVRELRGLLDR